MTHPAESTERIFGQAERRGVPPLIIVGIITVLAAVIILALVVGRNRPGRIAFDILGTGGEAQIYSINEDGSDLRQLTHEKAFNIMPIWSPDGQRIAYISSPSIGQAFQLYVMDADGSNVKSLTQGSSDSSYPHWSPDSRYIALITYRDKSWHVCVIQADGAPVFCTNTHSSGTPHPAWSPDGTRLALTAFQADAPQPRISIINADGTGLRELKGEGNYLISWLPDNNLSYKDLKGHLCLIAVDGSNDHCLPEDYGYTTQVAWSPDGKSIALASIQSGQYEIYVMNADGSNIRNLTDGTGGLSPVWSPDGQHIVFTSMRRNARSELFIMDRDGANPHSLLENKATSENASWVR